MGFGLEPPQAHCFQVGPHLGTRVPIGTFLTNWVPKGGPYLYQRSLFFLFLAHVPLLPSGSPFGDPGPHGDLFQFLGPQKVPIFFQGPHFLYFRLKNALKVRASTIILVICILKGEFSETHLFNENGTNLCTKWSHILWRCFSIILLLCISRN